MDHGSHRSMAREEHEGQRAPYRRALTATAAAIVVGILLFIAGYRD